MESKDQEDLLVYLNEDDDGILQGDILVSYLFDISKELNNFQYLWFSVIQLALIDVGIIRQRTSNQPTTSRQWFEARRWILSRNKGPQSLTWIWENLPFEMSVGTFVSLLLVLRCKKCGIKLLDAQCECRWTDENLKV